MVGPRSQTSPVTAQLISRRWGVFRFMQIVNNVQIENGSCSPKHDPAHFTVLKIVFVWMVWSFSKTFDLMAGPCSPKHGPVPSTLLKNLFVWMLCTRLKPFKFMAGPCSPTSSVTAQLISRRWSIFLKWCYAGCQQRSIEQLVVFPQTRFSSFHGVEAFVRLDRMKLFKYHQISGWAVFISARPSAFHGVKDPFRLDNLQSFKTIYVYGWAALPNIPCHDPAHFAALSNFFVVMLLLVVLPQTPSSEVMQIVNNLLINGCSCSPKHDPVHFTVLKQFPVWMVWSFSKTFKDMVGPCSARHGPVRFKVLINFFVWMLCSRLKTSKFLAGPRSPTSPVTAQLISWRWKVISFWCYAYI